MVVSYKFCQNTLENCENGKSQCVTKKFQKLSYYTLEATF